MFGSSGNKSKCKYLQRKVIKDTIRECLQIYIELTKMISKLGKFKFENVLHAKVSYIVHKE